MPLVIKCEHCQAALKLPEEYIGKEVQCPSCQREFIASAAQEAPPSRRAPEPREEEPPPRPDDDRLSRRGSDDEDRPRRRPDYDDEDRPSRRRRSYGDDYGRRQEPHRGGAIQTMGILSLVLFCFPLISVILGIIAIVMANGDLEKMRAGFMDRSGEGQTNTGKTCATIGVILAVLMFVGSMCLFCAGNAGGPPGRRF
jgi:hypothetical protein